MRLTTRHRWMIDAHRREVRLWRLILVALILAALLILAAPVVAQEPAEPDPAAEPSPIAASAWCIATDDGERSDSDPGCDVGAGVALFRWHRLSVVAVIGTETLGPGVAWVVHRPERGPVIAIAAGVVVRYGSEGIDAGEVYPALGATLSFGAGTVTGR